MYHLLAIFGLIVLSILLLLLRLIRLRPVRGIFYGQATFVHRCAIANFQVLLKDFNDGVRKRDGASALVILPEWIRELEADIDKLGKALNGSVFVFPFTKLFDDAVRMRERVKEARREVERQFKRLQAGETRPEDSDGEDSISKGCVPPVTPWGPVEPPKPQPQETTRPLRRTKAGGHGGSYH